MILKTSKKYKQDFICCLSVLLLCIGLMAGGCSFEGEERSAQLQILFSMQDTDDDFRNSLTEAVQKAAKEQGIELDVEYSGGSVTAQIEQVWDAESEGYDAVICYLSDPDSALRIEAVAGDMPVIFVSNKPMDDYLTADQYMFVGSQEAEAGTYQAEYVWNKLSKPKKLSVVMLKGEPGHSGTIGGTNAVYRFFEEKNVKLDIAYEDFAFWSKEEARKRFNQIIEAGKPFDAVFCNNDTMATGVVAAMKEHGISTEEIPVVGVDATQAGCRSILEGGMQFTVFQSASGQGLKSIETAVALIKTGTAESVEGLDEDGLCVWVPFEPVDASNVSDYYQEK